MKLGNNIQFLRNNMCLSQEELAEKCNVSRQSVTKWESGETTPTIEKLFLLADIFNVSLDELTGRSEINSYNRLMKLVKQLATDDIPTNETDDISAIISRYLLFTQHINLNATDTMNGLQDIFLNDIDKENEYYKH